MRIKAWVLFIIGDIASRVPWNSRVAALVYSKAMQYPARVGFDHNVGPFKEDTTRLYPDRFEDDNDG